jgi:hypothetical protein
MTKLVSLVARSNQLTNLTFQADTTNLFFVDIGENQLSKLILPEVMSRLAFLRVAENKLTELTLPGGMTNLQSLFLQTNRLNNLSLPEDLAQLVQLDLSGNELSELTIPASLTQLTSLVLGGNPLDTLVVSEDMAATNLAAVVTALRDDGVSVYTYPTAIQLIRLAQPVGAFQFGLTGPPGVYTILSSSDLTNWSPLGVTTNRVGNVVVTDGTAHLSAKKFYRAVRQMTSANGL